MNIGDTVHVTGKVTDIDGNRVKVSLDNGVTVWFLRHQVEARGGAPKPTETECPPV